MLRTTMARSPSMSSLRMRASFHTKPWQAIDVFDLAQSAGVEVRFARIASMEGMYLRQTAPVILVASDRPAGRKRFSCAHELGHHAFGDGSRIDELLEAGGVHGTREEEEIRADMFAGLLLMPKSAVQRGFSARGLSVETATAIDVFRVSSWLSVVADAARRSGKLEVAHDAVHACTNPLLRLLWSRWLVWKKTPQRVQPAAESRTNIA